MASGDRIFTFLAGENQPPASNPATPDLRNQHQVLDFDDTTNETGVFSGIFPPNYGGGNLSFTAFFAMTSATTGDIDVDVSVENDDAQDIDSDSFATVTSFDNVTVSGTSGQFFTVGGTISSSNMDGLGANDPFRIKITRDAASDTASGDAELWGFYANEA